MRVALIGDFPREPDRIHGGVEAVVAYLTRALASLPDLEVHTVTLKPNLGGEEIAHWNGVIAHYVPASFRFSNLTLHRRNKQRLRAALTRIDPDVIHAHIAGVYGQAAAAFGRPWALTVHGIRYRELALQPGLKNRLRQFMIGSFERDSIARARHLIAISPYVVNEFERIISAQVYHLENPIDSRFFALPNREKAHIVLFVGRIIPRKRAFELVKAIARVRAHIPDVELRMAGDPVESQAPGYMQVIRDYVRTEGLTDHVRFLGQLREDGLLDEYATCAVVALPSRQETAPMAIQEAMAAGKAVVSTRVGGIPHLVDHNHTGLLVDDGDVDGLAAAITTLIQDADMRRRMGDAGRAQAERRFHVDRVAARTREIYYGMLDQPVPVIEPETMETRLR